MSRRPQSIAVIWEPGRGRGLALYSGADLWCSSAAALVPALPQNPGHQHFLLPAVCREAAANAAVTLSSTLFAHAASPAQQCLSLKGLTGDSGVDGARCTVVLPPVRGRLCAPTCPAALVSEFGLQRISCRALGHFQRQSHWIDVNQISNYEAELMLVENVEMRFTSRSQYTIVVEDTAFRGDRRPWLATYSWNGLGQAQPLRLLPHLKTKDQKIKLPTFTLAVKIQWGVFCKACCAGPGTDRVGHNGHCYGSGRTLRWRSACACMART